MALNTHLELCGRGAGDLGAGAGEVPSTILTQDTFAMSVPNLILANFSQRRPKKENGIFGQLFSAKFILAQLFFAE